MRTQIEIENEIERLKLQRVSLVLTQTEREAIDGAIWTLEWVLQ